MRSTSRPGAATEVLVAAALCALMLAAPAPSGAGPRLRPGFEAGALWGGMSGADRLASGGDDATGPAGAFGAGVLEVAWSERWGLLTGFRARQMRERAPTDVVFFNGGVEYAYRLNTTVDLVSVPALARVRPARSRVLSLEVGPQVTWVTRAHSSLTWEAVASMFAPASPRDGSARTGALIFELLSADPTARYRNLFLEGVAGVVLEAPGIAHPPFVALRWTGGLTSLVGGAAGQARRTSAIELGAGWRW